MDKDTFRKVVAGLCGVAIFFIIDYHFGLTWSGARAKREREFGRQQIAEIFQQIYPYFSERSRQLLVDYWVIRRNDILSAGKAGKSGIMIGAELVNEAFGELSPSDQNQMAELELEIFSMFPKTLQEKYIVAIQKNDQISIELCKDIASAFKRAFLELSKEKLHLYENLLQKGLEIKIKKISLQHTK